MGTIFSILLLSNPQRKKIAEIKMTFDPFEIPQHTFFLRWSYLFSDSVSIVIASSSLYHELELELQQTHMTQMKLLRVEMVRMCALASRNVGGGIGKAQCVGVGIWGQSTVLFGGVACFDWCSPQVL